MLRTLLFSSLVFISTLSCASDSDLLQKWNECAEAALSHYDQTEGGMTGAYLEIIEKCGLHPVVETSHGLRLLSNDCDWIYERPLNECTGHLETKEWCSKGDDTLLISMSSWREFWLLSDKVFKRANFFALCRRICQGESLPDRKQFADSFCRAP